VPTISFRLLNGLLIMGHGRRQIWFGVTRSRTSSSLPRPVSFRHSGYPSVRASIGVSGCIPKAAPSRTSKRLKNYGKYVIRIFSTSGADMSGFVRTIVLLTPSFLIGIANALGLECSSKTADTLVIALDVGHVPKIPGHECVRFVPCFSGATSARGVTEYEFNIKLATSIKEELIRAGFRSTHLMVPTPNSSLQMRVDRAIALKADLFISIHHDSVRDEFLKPWTFDGRKNWYFDDSSGFSLHVSTKNVKYSESLGLARAIADQLIANGLHFSTAHDPKNLFGARKPYVDASRGIYRRDALRVLTRANMPAVLLEGGTIVNREEELEVSTPSYRSRIATSVATAIRSFCGYAASVATDRVIDDVVNARSGTDSNRATIGTVPSNEQQ
jgi:N-acetylmuramoyl-L-alanine amidase